MSAHSNQALSSYDSREDRTLSEVHEKPDSTGSLLLSLRAGRKDPGMGRLLQQSSLSRGHRQCHAQ